MKEIQEDLDWYGMINAKIVEDVTNVKAMGIFV